MGQVYTKMFTFYRLLIITKPVEYPQPYTRGTSKLAPAPGGWTHGWTCPATTFSAGEPLLARMMVLEATTLSRLVERAGRFLCRCTGAAGGCPTVPDPAVTARCRGSPRYITTSRGGQPGLAAPAPSGLYSTWLHRPLGAELSLVCQVCHTGTLALCHHARLSCQICLCPPSGLSSQWLDIGTSGDCMLPVRSPI